nr:Protein GCY-22, isoform c [Haemonchus contortus]
MTMTYRRQISNFTNATFKNVLQAIKDVSRITVICLESPEARRNLLIAIAEESMDTNEYMWLMVESRRLGFGEAWKDTKAVPDGKDSLALRAAQKFLVIDSEPLNASAQFIDDIEAKMRQPPYNCTDCENIDPGHNRPPKKRTKMAICTFNGLLHTLPTLVSEACIEDLMMQARKFKYEVIGLTETKRHRALHAVFGTGEELFLGTCDSRGVGGVSVLVNAHLAMNIDSYESLTTRIGRL